MARSTDRFAVIAVETADEAVHLAPWIGAPISVDTDHADIWAQDDFLLCFNTAERHASVGDSNETGQQTSISLHPQLLDESQQSLVIEGTSQQDSRTQSNRPASTRQRQVPYSKDALLSWVLDQEMREALGSPLPTPVDFLAANRLQNKFRHILRRRIIEHKGIYRVDALAYLREPAFASCLAADEHIQWRSRRYRRLFLGALPHALSSLEAACSKLRTLKGVASDQLMKSTSTDMEDRGQAVKRLQ